MEVLLKNGVSMAAGRVAIEKVLTEFPTVQLMDRSQVLAAQSKQINSLLVPVTALLALSVVIALLGIANTLALSIHERTQRSDCCGPSAWATASCARWCGPRR